MSPSTSKRRRILVLLASTIPGSATLGVGERRTTEKLAGESCVLLGFSEPASRTSPIYVSRTELELHGTCRIGQLHTELGKTSLCFPDLQDHEVDPKEQRRGSRAQLGSIFINQKIKRSSKKGIFSFSRYAQSNKHRQNHLVLALPRYVHRQASYAHIGSLPNLLRSGLAHERKHTSSRILPSLSAV